MMTANERNQRVQTSTKCFESSLSFFRQTRPKRSCVMRMRMLQEYRRSFPSPLPRCLEYTYLPPTITISRTGAAAEWNRLKSNGEA